MSIGLLQENDAIRVPVIGQVSQL